ncbi:MAG TPA: phosphoribosylanthranilate isomerase, partial [Candidatus Polarisedimenticolaceae bacterium]|nr:phosphoribosylanthranilate isomerase [Candidatus Polarisedimenticolaceae bacterium]
MRVKVCGMTRVEDAQAAVAAGADAVGCLVGLDGAPRDEVPAALARVVFASLPPFVTRVLVTHRTATEDVLELVRATGAQVVQLHGAFALGAVADLRAHAPFLSIVKAAHVVDEGSIAPALEAARVADAVLLDSRTADRIGGTGQVHDWSISVRIVERSAAPVILAGGLTPDNVAEAIARVRPWGVDVNSGVRGPDGSKSHERIRAFVVAAKGQGIR